MRSAVALSSRCAVSLNSRCAISFNSGSAIGLNSRGTIGVNARCVVLVNSWRAVGAGSSNNDGVVSVFCYLALESDLVKSSFCFGRSFFSFSIVGSVLGLVNGVSLDIISFWSDDGDGFDRFCFNIFNGDAFDNGGGYFGILSTSLKTKAKKKIYFSILFLKTALACS